MSAPVTAPREPTRLTDDVIQEIGPGLRPWFVLCVLPCRCCWVFFRRDLMGGVHKLEIN